jgi:hypothetical protein
VSGQGCERSRVFFFLSEVESFVRGGSVFLQFCLQRSSERVVRE